MSQVKRILHLASFNGNIGDNINHSGFRPWFAGLCAAPIEWRQLEIRSFYRGELTFAKDLPALASKSDMLVVGGGNYLELWPSNTASGMSLDLPLEQLGSMGKPVLLNALGVDAGQGVSERGRQGLQLLIDWISADPRRLLSVRNDGSFEEVKRLCHSSSLANVHRIPDAGFFQTLSRRTDSFGLGSLQVCVNLAMDMGGHRYPGGTRVNYADFCVMFAKVIADVSSLRTESNWVFVPHIYSDLRIISDVIAELPDSLRRNRVEVAPFGSGEIAAETAMATYSNADLVMGMRFHACIAGLSLGIPTIGLTNYPQVGKLFEEVGAPQLSVDVSTSAGIARLGKSILDLLEHPVSARTVGAEILYRVSAERRRFESVLTEWLGHVGMTPSPDSAPA